MIVVLEGHEKMKIKKQWGDDAASARDNFGAWVAQMGGRVRKTAEPS